MIYECVFESIFDSKCEALVNPVNCVGVMGAGLAKQFKLKYPKNYNIYKDRCDLSHLRVGKCLITRENGVFIANFTTKNHYKNPSELRWIKDGLIYLRKQIYVYDIKSIAIPALGCGYGGLNWIDVKDLVYKTFEHFDYYVELYAPRGLK